MKDLIETLEEYANGFINVIAPPEEDVKELLEHIYNQDKEIERLNNIINRTTKYVESLSSKGRGCDIYEDIKQEILQELKGVDKE